MNLLTMILSVVILAILAFGIYGREKTWLLFFGNADLGAIDFKNFTPSKKPNHALFCPIDYCPNAKRSSPSPVFDIPANELKNKLLSLILSEQNIQQVASDDDNLEYRFVQHTPVMRYPDTIRVKFISLTDQKSTLAIFSESQVGQSDMGVNYKRVNGWMDVLEGK